ncbi:hypothetical protein ABZ119_26005 [Streptomyces sp. NPDC006288]|uniref:hypothetical protein n=1 Tax=Streptomyces sp. NPDC006288 TaxID=3156743 RepID=UPI0033B0F007
MNNLSKVAFGLVLFVALAISWQSLYTLSVETFHMPQWLGAGVSLAFDGAALVLANITSQYARSPDSGFGAKMGTYLLILTSVLLNVLHARMMGYGLPGEILYGAAPAIAGLLFETHLRFIHRQALRERGRVLDQTPLVGKAAYLFHPVISYRVYDKSLRARLLNASRTLPDIDQTADIFQTRKNRQTAEPLSVEVVREPQTDTKPLSATSVRSADKQTRTQTPKALTAGQTDNLPDWLPRDEGLSVSRLASVCVENGLTDIDTAYRYAQALKGQDVPRATIQKSLRRAIQKTEGTGLYL